MDYKIKELCNTFGFGVSKFYKLKEMLDNSIPEQNRIEYYYSEGRKFFVTEKGFEWFKSNLDNISVSKSSSNNNSNSVVLYQNQIIEMYKQRIEYLENENKRLLDIISFKEQKELTKDIKYIDNNDKISFFNRIINKFKK